MAVRKIVEIDREKCDGCGQCATACAEGAIAIRNGKAELVSEVYCDGLGACLGECPRDAIRIIEREAAGFDEAATHVHLQRMKQAANPQPQSLPVVAQAEAKPARPQHGCPGSAVHTFGLQFPRGAQAEPKPEGQQETETPSELTHWPVQLHLVPPAARFLQGAEVLLVADCVPFALADFHARFLRGRPVVIGCPKLDDGQAYVGKLVQMLRTANIRRLTVVHMEVPCCTGLVRIAEMAKSLSGVDVPLEHVTISLRGQVLATETLSAVGA